MLITQTVTLAAGAVTWLCGVGIVKKVPLFKRYNLPAPVIGGIACAGVLAAFQSQGIAPPIFDTHLLTPLLIAFFASIGFGASIADLRKGGKAVLLFLAICSVLLVLQVLVGIVVAQAVGKPALFGVLTSAVSLVGGPGTALSFAPEFEKAGVASAGSIGVTAAMLGIVFGGLLGAPLATVLIGRQESAAKNQVTTPDVVVEKDTHDATFPYEKIASELMYHVAWILIIGSLGYYLSLALADIGLKLPFYVGGMIVAFTVRNLDETYKLFNLNKDWIEAIGGACLILFISTSMMVLDLSSVAAVAGPLLTNLVIQTALVSVISITVVYWLMGRDYNAAVIGGGTIGFMMGTTANALATMKSLTERFGPAPRALLVVPLVGACFIDFINAIVISIALSFFS
jgi:ESS family glutamate:Na+ symporter